MDIVEEIDKQVINGYRMLRRRLVYEGAVYHVTQRAPGREVVFVGDGDHLYFLKTLKETAAAFNLEVFSFALMPNHLHLLFRIKEKNLSLAMKYLFERYADFFNKKYQRKGHVFCGRFRASLCNDDLYLVAASIYIHLNPLRAGLSNSLEGYRWTSLGLYLYHPRDSFVRPESVLLILDSNFQKASRLYLEILSKRAMVQEGLSLARQFIECSIRCLKQDIGRITNKDGSEDLNILIEEFKYKRTQRDPEAKKAKKYVIQQLVANGHKIDEITQKLGISKATYYRLI